MKDILQDIVANKRLEVERQRQAVPLSLLLGLGSEQLERPTRSMRRSIAACPPGIIAEFKRKSPSKGWLHPGARVADVVQAYEAGGAAACSILTDTDFFGGSLGDLREARRLTRLPLLRKDFVVDAYQLYQARAMGADAVLLIAACLTPAQCCDFAGLAHTLGLEVLLEIHSEEELGHLQAQADMVGINNRNLGSFHTDVGHSFQLAETVQQALAEQANPPLLISESGISDPASVNKLREAGFSGFLIGETFMKTEQPGETLKQFIGGATR